MSRSKLKVPSANSTGNGGNSLKDVIDDALEAFVGDEFEDLGELPVIVLAASFIIVTSLRIFLVDCMDEMKEHVYFLFCLMCTT